MWNQHTSTKIVENMYYVNGLSILQVLNKLLCKYICTYKSVCADPVVLATIFCCSHCCWSCFCFSTAFASCTRTRHIHESESIKICTFISHTPCILTSMHSMTLSCSNVRKYSEIKTNKYLRMQSIILLLQFCYLEMRIFRLYLATLQSIDLCL